MKLADCRLGQVLRWLPGRQRRRVPVVVVELANRRVRVRAIVRVEKGLSHVWDETGKPFWVNPADCEPAKRGETRGAA
jgi:hypothetical protein